jgi:hypothetical protein
MSTTQGEHTFAEGVLVSGENIDSYTAGEDLTARTGVSMSGDYTVSEPAADAGDFVGVVAYDVSSGEEVAVIKRDCEVKVSISESVTAGDELVPDGSGGFETVATSGLSAGFLIATEGGSSSDVIRAEIFSAGGATT